MHADRQELIGMMQRLSAAGDGQSYSFFGAAGLLVGQIGSTGYLESVIWGQRRRSPVKDLAMMLTLKISPTTTRAAVHANA